MRSTPMITAAAVGLVLIAAGCGSSPTAGGSSSSPTPVATTAGSAAGGAAGSSAAGPASSGGAASGASTSGSAGSAGASGASGAIPACGTSGADTFTFSSDGDVNIQNLWQQTLLPAFKKACPNLTVNFVFDTHSANANLNVSKIAAAEKAGQAPPFDVASESVGATAAQAGLTEKLSAAEIPAMNAVSPQAIAAYDSLAVPYRGSSVLLAYDSTKITDPPKTLKDLLAWIKANSGQFTYNDPASGGSGMAFAETVVDSYLSPQDLTALQSGYSPQLQSKWAPGLATLKALTPSIYQQVYPNGNQAVLDLLSKGEISLAPVWSDQFLSAKSKGLLGDEYKVVQISDPSFTGGAAYMAVIKGTAHAAAAKAFIQWVLQPAQQAEIVKTIAGFPAISMSTLPADVQSAFGNVNTQDLRVGMSSKNGADFKSKWAATVPG